MNATAANPIKTQPQRFGGLEVVGCWKGRLFFRLDGGPVVCRRADELTGGGILKLFANNRLRCRALWPPVAGRPGCRLGFDSWRASEQLMAAASRAGIVQPLDFVPLRTYRRWSEVRRGF